MVPNRIIDCRTNPLSICLLDQPKLFLPEVKPLMVRRHDSPSSDRVG
jgi:hypothetical protein